MKLRPAEVTRSLVLKASSVATAVATTVGRWGSLFSASSGDKGPPGSWQQGIVVDAVPDLTAFGAVYACVSHIASDIAKLQPRIQERNMEKGGIWQDSAPNSPFWRLLEKPNPFQNRIQFMLFWIATKLIHGNAIVLKRRESVRGMVNGLFPLDPRRVTPLVTEMGDVYYQIANDPLAQVPAQITVPASEVIHDRGLTLWHPLWGTSPLWASGASATQGRLIQANSQQFFKNMSRPSGMLTGPATISQVTADRLKKEFEEKYSSNNIGRMAVLGDGLKYEAITMAPETAQLIQQLGWSVEDVARTFKIPLYKINHGPVPTSNNVEALDLQYYAGCLQLLIESVEACMTEGLELKVGMRYDLDLTGLLRMDSSTHVKTLVEAVKGTIMTPNEARILRNMEPKPGGDVLLSQQQNYSLEALAKRDAKDDPFSSSAPPPPAPPADSNADPEEEPEDDSAPADPPDSEEDQQAQAFSDGVLKELIERITAGELLDE